MKTKIITLILIVSSALMLIACGDEVIPDLNEEQTELITEYAAALLLKYDSSTTSRLLPEGEGDSHVVLPDHSQDVPIPTGDKITQSNDEPLVGADDVIVNSPVDDSTKPEAYGDGFGSIVNNDGISLEYANSYEVVDSYPTEGENAYFTVDASEGNKLLVLHFNLKGLSDTDTEVDMNKYSMRLRVSVNGGDNHYVLNTMLTNDILSFKGLIGSGENADIVAIAEIPEGECESISSITLTIRGDEGSSVINLQ